VVVKVQDNPLTGVYLHEHDPLIVTLSNTILNLAHPNHLREALQSRQIGKARR
jgi:hypothetical protein